MLQNYAPHRGREAFFQTSVGNPQRCGGKVSFWNGDGSMICNMYDFASLVGPKTHKEVILCSKYRVLRRFLIATGGT